MTNIVGIIPAGGKAERFRGMAKELLPISQTDCALTRAIRAMQDGGADEVYIATSQAKTLEHYKAVAGLHGVHLTAREFRGLWEVIAFIGESAKADLYYFAMADTVFPDDAFKRDTSHDVTCGAFYTKKAGRFGILAGNRIVDKNPSLVGDAWGVWIWTADAMECLVKACRETRDHTAALNRLLDRFGVDTFYMPYYYDFAAFEDYTEFLCSLT
jgi:hypothetical protein